ncbi:MAG: hypothetical protein WBG92_22850 [Thiohalocapsa sp.]
MSFGDIFDDLQPSGMVVFTANKDRLGFATDLQYVETETKSTALRPLFGGFGYRITDSISSTLGHRWVKVDYERGDFLYDVR